MAIQFNDTSTAKNGLLQKCESKLFGNDYGAITDNAKLKATITRLINDGLNRLSQVIAQADTRWQFHDSNFTTHPWATTDLNVAGDGQQDYKLADIHQEVRSVSVKNSEGTFKVLQPIDAYDIRKHGTDMSEFESTNGMPEYYDKVGRSIFLYPAPASADVTTSGGLKIDYVSAPSYFITTDTTKTAGVPEPFQDYPAIWASHIYAGDNEMDKKYKKYGQQVMDMEVLVQEFYARRDKDDKPQMRPRKRNYT